MYKGKQLQNIDDMIFFYCLTVVAPASLKATFTQMQNDYFYI